MSSIVCSNNKIKVYKNTLNNTYNNRKIHYKDLKSCIHNIWQNVEFIDIVIQNNEFNLQVCCLNDNNIHCNTRRYFDAIEKHSHLVLYKKQDLLEECSEKDSSYVKVARELNEWQIGSFIIEKINILSTGYDYDTMTDINPNKSVIIPLGVPISRINEFYGVRGLNR